MPVSKVRTAEELKNAEYNYYLAFRIEPTEKNPDHIDEILKKEKNQWVQGKPLYRRYKELEKDIFEVMVNDRGYDPATDSYTRPNARAEEAQRAKSLKLCLAASIVVEICVRRKIIYKSELIQIANSDRVRWFTPQELEQEVSYLFKQGIKYIDDTQTLIDFNKYKDIRSWLITAKKKDLYDFLSVSNTATIQEIRAAKDIVARNNKNPTTPEGTATNRLLGEVDNIFKSNETRLKYDQWLAVHEKVWDRFEDRYSLGIGSITLGDYQQYAEIMMTVLKLDIDTVEVMLAAGLKHYKLKVIGEDGTEVKDANGNAIDLEICPYADCEKAYRVDPAHPAKTCPHCGKPLEIRCWNCGSPMPFTKKSKICPSCGSTIQSRELFDKRLAEMRQLLNSPSATLSDLQNGLINLKNAVTGKSPAGSHTAKIIAECESAVSQRVREEETEGNAYRAEEKKIRTLISEKKFRSALSLASMLKTKYPNYNVQNTSAILSEINKALAQANAAEKAARDYAARNDRENAIAFAVRALSICSDSSDALAKLQKYPPYAPSVVNVSVTDKNTSRITWNCSAQNYVTYSVIKKLGSQPRTPTDGTIIASGISSDLFEDDKLSSASPYYYGVFADRYGVKSAVTSSTSYAVIYLDITGIYRERVEGAIKIGWECPDNVKAVEVWKSSGSTAPLQRGQGTQVTCSKNGFTDTGASSQTSYLIICRYELNGQSFYSRGVRVTFNPIEIVAPPESYGFKPEQQGRYTFKHSKIKAGRLKFVSSSRKLTCETNVALETSLMGSALGNCSEIRHTAVSDTAASVMLNDGFFSWVYPVIYNNEFFVVCKPSLLYNLKLVDNLTVNYNGNGIVTLKGTLHPMAKKLVAVVNSDSFIKSAKDTGDRTELSRDDLLKGHTLVLKQNQVSYISAYATLEKDGCVINTEPFRLYDNPIDVREKRMVNYVFDYKPKNTGNFNLTLKFSSNAPLTLNGLMLRRGIPRPLDVNSGEIILLLPDIELKKGMLSSHYTAKVTILCHACSEHMKFAIFKTNATHDYIELREVKNL